jgi:cytochrome c-type protein NapC
MVEPKPKPGLMSRKVLLGTTLGAAVFFMIIGVIFWGGFNTAMEVTNTLTFCISCHEMEENVYQEYKKTVHYSNRSGVRATCSDCHVPDPWVHKVVRKVQASNEVLHKVLGTIDTPEKFNEHRLALAKRVWAAMKSTDSRECRNCHDFGSMNPENQKGRARKQHINGMEAGNTCIDCHKGIAHSKVHDQLSDEELEALEKPDPANKRPIPPQWVAFIEEEGSKKSKPKTPKPAVAPQPAAPAVAEEAKPVAESTATASAAAPAAVGATASGFDWSGVPETEVVLFYPGQSSMEWVLNGRDLVLFYPGQSSMEWVLNGRDHSGVRPLKAGDRCYDCHDGEEADIGELIVLVSGEKLEPNPIPGKRGSIAVNIQAAHDSEYLYMRFQWEDTEHAPVAFVDGGKMDADNQTKLAIMLTTDDEKVEFADRAGCWQTCHHDARSMPDTPDEAAMSSSPVAQTLNLADGVTKYLKESRTELEIKGKEGKPRGGWDKLKDTSDIEAALADGQFMDLLRFNSGGESEDGYILAERVMTGGQGVSFSGGLNDGVWTVEMKRKLTSDQPSDARYHHVSLGFKLGFDDEDAEINAVGK